MQLRFNFFKCQIYLLIIYDKLIIFKNICQENEFNFFFKNSNFFFEFKKYNSEF